MYDALRAPERRDVIARQRALLEAEQKPDGHYVFELEADTTIPAEYVLLRHFISHDRMITDPARDTERRIAAYLRSQQNPDGSWPLFHKGDGEISSTVKAYWALKLTGEDTDAAHMSKARNWVLERGGAAKANVFTRFAMALFGEVPWRAVPVMPVEIMLLPQWFPFHMSKVAYWSRTVIAGLLILYARKAKASNPTGLNISELFQTPPDEETNYNINPTGSFIGKVFLKLDEVMRWAEPRLMKTPFRKVRALAEKKAVAFITERLNGEDGLGGIYPAMANAVMAFYTLGYAKDHPDFVTALSAVEKLRIDRGDQTYYQPCLSPVWDTCLAAQSLLEAGADRNDEKLIKALDWLASKQILELRGDWISRRPHVRPGGWAFQYENPHYPDVDDTAVVGMAVHRADPERYRENIARAEEWIRGMQSGSGGWGAFEPENEHDYLNSIPFADHGALLDPPTEDVTARCLSMLCQLGYGREDKAVVRAIDYLKKTQQADGSWFGRWGANYIYGTWSVLCALNAAGEDLNAAYIRKAADWLEARQREDGGWGEDLASYWSHRKDEVKASTPSQTAWALMGLMAAGRSDSAAAASRAAYLVDAPKEGARRSEDLWSGTGFPRVFYLKYHGYAAYFPLWALARYEALQTSNSQTTPWGM
ncbi:MAG: squalene--hopene cyclase [Maricaulaceae bacterium]